MNPPADCTLGESCFIQNHVDRDPGPGAADFTCGALTYDGHKGTDFALPSLAAMRDGVNVLAAAPGTVSTLRDGMPDTGLQTPGLDGRECGNGVVIDHGGGWQTQYCHMKQGSIRVETGQRVAKGAVLGQIGLSGQTEFPHVHLAVRRDGAVVDPFAPEPGPVTCTESTRPGLWQQPVPYRPGAILSLGFAARPPAFELAKAGLSSPERLPGTAPALILWAHAFGGRAGDVLALEIDGPDGRTVLAHDAVLERDQARVFRFAGRPLRASAWPEGTYRGKVSLRRGGETLSRRAVTLRVTR
ncbi:M23 family metallopeptidase [Actibacterium sp. MT2.3-13A]|uniref:M23 family metallopeptidase n=1 Tax=Actibacterium sp. MT2.3-13A TaxID=2828332 RepID=UPI00201307DE|nr:M23 family metallopeptidase [Actibacterium sp. MT2.3-13A]